MTVDGPSPVIKVDSLRKVYGGEVALEGASFQIDRPGVHGLLGANGAGKSTMVRIISGVEVPDGGGVEFEGETLPHGYSPSDAAAAGIAYIDQDRALIPDLSIAENVALTLGYPRRSGLISMRSMRRAAERTLAGIGIEHDVDTPVGELPISDQTMVAVARALATDARLILLDEPTSNLGQSETEWLLDKMRELVSRGITCVLITHALSEALRVCDEITVLRDGRVVATSPAAGLDEATLTDLMSGPVDSDAEPVPAAPRGAASAGETVLELDEVRCDRVGPISLGVRRGEILAVTGLADAGHVMLGDAVAGVAPLSEGSMRLRGERYLPSGVSDAREQGVVAVPPDRMVQGLALEMNVRENLFLDGSAHVSGFGGIDLVEERKAAARIMEEAEVKAGSSETVLSSLSGGNLQKVLIAKWLGTEPDVIALCEPTVGIDVRAREEVYRRLRHQVAQGLAVMLLSSDFEEIVELADRVIVLRYGVAAAELSDPAEISVDRIAALASAA